MDRTSDTTKHTDLFGSGKHGYRERTSTDVPTRFRASNANAHQEELCAVPEGVSPELVGLSGGLKQVLGAINAMRCADALMDCFEVQVDTTNMRWRTGCSTAVLRTYGDGSDTPVYRLIVAGNDTVSGDALVYTSDDGGASWAARSVGTLSEIPKASSSVPDSADAQFMIVCEDGRWIYLDGNTATDGVVSGNPDFTAVIWDHVRLRWLATASGGTDRGIFYSDAKSPTTWTLVPSTSGVDFTSIAISPAGVVVATRAGANTVYTSSDGTAFAAGANPGVTTTTAKAVWDPEIEMFVIGAAANLLLTEDGQSFTVAAFGAAVQPFLMSGKLILNMNTLNSFALAHTTSADPSKWIVRPHTVNNSSQRDDLAGPQGEQCIWVRDAGSSSIRVSRRACPLG